MKELVYSLNEEEYYELDDLIDIIGMDNISEDKFIYVAERVNLYHKDFINVDSLIDDMIDKAEDKVGEFYEGYLFKVPKEKVESLEQVILKWFNENIEQPSFFIIKNPRKIMLEEVINLELIPNKKDLS